ncbi:hypothetical protein FA15DRAFT_674716 [Coprinopsis marcescibilis]|uniref:Uncharacterized protein n=1 Tax=Coprinopsis marcescibilis TaxID=230819 RepID=A0A5C3KGQ7_COPMA|nr:hypothetical protein FA15DRAFT_674716 [Coprinopsis marcescibilis]
MYPLSLPLELVQNISGQAEISDVKSLRLVCKAFAMLLAGDLFYCLVIDMSKSQDRLEILSSLASDESHPARTATRELSIQRIDLDEPSEVTSCLIPALQSLGNLRKLRLRYFFTDLEWIYTPVLECLKPMLPRITTLEVSRVNAELIRPNIRQEALIAFLSDPGISRLASFAIDCGGGSQQNINSALVTAAANVVERSRSHLECLAFGFPSGISIRNTPATTLRTIFRPSPHSSFPVLTHLTLAEDIICDIRSCTPTVPQFSSLKHLTCVPKPAKRPIAVENQPNTFDFWTALASTGVRLHSIKEATATHELFHYLKSYSGELQELQINRFRAHGDGKDKWQDLGEEFWSCIVPLHHASLRLLHIRSNCDGWWSFGPITQDIFQSHAFPALEELLLNVHSSAQTSADLRKGYVITLLDLVSQSQLFGSLKKLVIMFPIAPTGGWCGTGRATLEGRYTRTESSNILAHSWPPMARLPNLTVAASYSSGIRLFPVLIPGHEEWKYERSKMEDDLSWGWKGPQRPTRFKARS